ncbi:MAG: hypothetical protein Q9168_005819 [Polycauliona sp. 1 TL-2023]
MAMSMMTVDTATADNSDCLKTLTPSQDMRLLQDTTPSELSTLSPIKNALQDAMPRQEIAYLEPNTKPSPFLQLPLEIRRMIYGSVLPFHEDDDMIATKDILFVLRWKPQWNKQRRINVLATNQQIYAETVPMLYTQMRCEIFAARPATIMCSPSSKSHSVRDGELKLPMQAGFIRHCEVVTRFLSNSSIGRFPNDGGSDKGKVYTQEEWNAITIGISACAKALSTLSPLGTLTFKLNCQHNTNFKSSQEAVEFWTRILEPFDQVRVNVRWTVIMVGWWDTKCSCGKDSCAEVGRLLQEHFASKIRPVSE